VEKTDRHIILSVQYSSKDLYNKDKEYNRFFEVADYESIIRFQKFKMADPVWRTKIHKVSKLDKNWYIGVFEVTDYESIIRFLKFEDLDSVFTFSASI